MFVTDVVVDKQSLNLINRKAKISFAFICVFALGILVSLATIIFGIVAKISDFNTYLFAAFGFLIAGFWLYASIVEFKKSKLACFEILDKGSHVITGAIEVNAEHKYNGTTILNLVCSVLVLVCFIVEIVLQIVKFNMLTLYIIPITFVLASYMIYQTLIGFTNDKLYRNVIFEKE